MGRVTLEYATDNLLSLLWLGSLSFFAAFLPPLNFLLLLARELVERWEPADMMLAVRLLGQCWSME